MRPEEANMSKVVVVRAGLEEQDRRRLHGLGRVQ